MKEHVRQKLNAFQVRPGDTIGVAVSGGVDSMTLLDVLCNLRAELNIIVVAYHFEHGIRGEESVADMRLVQAESAARGVKCVTGGADVAALARETGESLETAARRARYAFLDAQPPMPIATAHHAGDMAETVLMNLCRGSGLAGLCGIPESRGRYIRPLLGVTREKIEEYAAARGVRFAHDSTNDDTGCTRNYVRREILPRLKALNGQAIKNIAAAARLLAEDEAALMRAADDAGGIEREADGVAIDIAALLSQSAAVRKRMIRRAAGEAGGLKDLSQTHVDDLLALARRGISGKQAMLPGGMAAWVEYGKLKLGKEKQTQYNNSSIDFHGEGCYPLNGMVLWCEKGVGIVRSPGTECFDAAQLNGACFRRRRDGDVIRPLGMSGTKRLSDYLSDRKVPLLRRDGLMVMAKGGEVLWVIGVGVSETSRVKEDGPVLIIRCEEKQNA